MPRTRRITVPGHPHHIFHQGHNGRMILKREEDFIKCQNDMRELKLAFNVQVIAYCLLPSQINLIINPGGSPRALSSFMRALSGTITHHRNREDNSAGTVWGGRFRSSPVQPKLWLLRSQKYLELLPVLTGLASSPGAYRWSSYLTRLGQTEYDWLDESPQYHALGATLEERRENYRRYVQAGMDDFEINRIETAVRRCQLTGDDRFIDEVELLTGTRVSKLGPGRPPKK